LLGPVEVAVAPSGRGRARPPRHTLVCFTWNNRGCTRAERLLSGREVQSATGTLPGPGGTRSRADALRLIHILGIDVPSRSSCSPVRPEQADRSQYARPPSTAGTTERRLLSVYLREPLGPGDGPTGNAPEGPIRKTGADPAPPGPVQNGRTQWARRTGGSCSSETSVGHRQTQTNQPAAGPRHAGPIAVAVGGTRRPPPRRTSARRTLSVHLSAGAITTPGGTARSRLDGRMQPRGSQRVFTAGDTTPEPPERAPRAWPWNAGAFALGGWTAAPDSGRAERGLWSVGRRSAGHPNWRSDAVLEV